MDCLNKIDLNIKEKDAVREFELKQNLKLDFKKQFNHLSKKVNGIIDAQKVTVKQLEEQIIKLQNKIE